MNIALFASAFYPSLGGVEELCRQLAMELMRQGHGVIVLTNRWPRDLPARETLDGIPVYRLPFRLPEGSAKAAINYHLTHSRIERDMLAILRAHKIDVLHVQCVSSNAHYAMIAQEKLKLPLVVTLQGELTMDANQIFQKSSQAQETLRRALDRADVITACSGKTLRDGEEFYGKPFGERGRVIFNGVNLGEFGALRFNDQRSMTNTTKELGVRSEELEGRDGGDGLQVTGDRGMGTEGTGLAGQPAGRDPAGAEPTASAALNGRKRGSPEALIRDPCSLVIEPQRRPYIFALGRMAKQKGFDVLIKAYGLINEQRTTNNECDPQLSQIPQIDGATKELEVRSWKLEECDAGEFIAKTQRHEGRGDDPQITQIPQIDGAGGFTTEETEVMEAENTANTESVICNPSPVTCNLASTSNSSSAAAPDLVLAGDGPELEPLKALARELGLGDCVHFPGRADRQQVAAYLSGCEFFVISSPAEPFGIVVLEAMAAGAAVIAVNNAGPAEIITNGVDGLLVDRSEPKLFATAMRRLIGDPELRQRLAAGGRARAGEFSWPVIAHQYAAAYAAAATKELGVRS